VDQLLSAVLTTNSLSGAVLKQYGYSYDFARNRLSEKIQNGTNSSLSLNTASYNVLDQLTNITSTGGPMLFAGDIDKTGAVMVAGAWAGMYQQTNFTAYPTVAVGTNTVPVVAVDYYGNFRTNQYQVVVTNNGFTAVLTYDLNGNETSSVTSTQTNTYEWDAANRLTAINSGTNRSEFTYDGVGRRVQIIEKQNGTPVSTNKFLWCGMALSEVRDNTGATVLKRYLAGGQQVSGTSFLVTGDHLGSVREMTDTTGAIRARYEYDPYGRQTKVQGDQNSDFTYARMYSHKPSGLLLALFRTYDPNIGRWLSRDPLGGSYGYAANSPFNFMDPLGLAPSQNDQFWLNVYENGLNDAGQFASTIGQAALAMGMHNLGYVFNPIGTAIDDAVGAYNAIDYASKEWANVIYNPCEAQGFLKQLEGLFTSPEGIADATLFAESLLAGGLLGPEGAAEEMEVAEGIAGPCFVAGTVVATDVGAQPIETLHVGDRVLTSDPNASGTKIEPTSWRHVSLRMPNPECPSEDNLDLELLRSEAWTQTSHCTSGARIWLDLDEMGLHGWADVVSVDQCSRIQSGKGRVITATVTHLNSFVMEVHFAGAGQSLEPTDRHLLFSVTRNGWVRASQLESGEELAARTGTVCVDSVTAKPGTHRVYNIEVETDHCYYAGTFGILSHNTCAQTLGPKASSVWDTSGGLKGIVTDVTSSDFIANLKANGYTERTAMGKNGPVTILENGQGSTYTVYTRKSTKWAGVQYVGPNGLLKYNLPK
jgi:RHS repeat-associated protein